MHKGKGLRCMPYVLGPLLMVPGTALAQGVSGITIQSIGVTPAEFRPGQALSITINVKAPPGASSTGAVRAYVSVFKGNANGRLTWLAADWLDGARQEEPALSAGEVRPIQFSKTVVIPNPPTGQIPVIYLVAGAFDPPAEFAQERIAGFDFKCPGSPTDVCRYIKRRVPLNKWVGP